jgi:hypothetical protein
LKRVQEQVRERVAHGRHARAVERVGDFRPAFYRDAAAQRLRAEEIADGARQLVRARGRIGGRRLAREAQ